MSSAPRLGSKASGTRLAALSAVVLAFVALADIPATARQPHLADVWNGAEIAWRDVGPGIRESTRSGRPVVMVFHAEWCKACRRYREVWKDPGVVSASRDFVMILIDVDRDPKANGAFSPDGTYVPRTIFYDSEGDVMSHVRGKDPEYPHTVDIEDPAELRTLMQKAAGSESAPESDRRASNAD